MKNTKLILAAAALLLVASPLVLAQSTTDPGVNALIVGGTEVNSISDVPWQVALVDDGTRNQFCGGSLVAKDWVLTAAHCVDSFIVASNPDRLDVVAGTLEFAHKGEQISVEAIHIHPEWDNGNFDHDAALLKLSSASTLGKPIAMLAQDESLPTGPDVRVTGWGATSEGGPGSSKLLMVDVPVVSNETCNAPASYDGAITEAMFCAGKRDGGLDACQGDSGGPVDSFLGGGDKLVGIVSWGHGCARRLKFGVYTRVSSISQWASETMAGY